MSGIFFEPRVSKFGVREKTWLKHWKNLYDLPTFKYKLPRRTRRLRCFLHILRHYKWNIQWVALKVCSVLSKTDEYVSGNVLLHCCMYHSSSGIKCLMRGAKTIILYRHKPFHKPADSMNKTKRKIKTPLQRQQRYFSLLQVFKLFYHDSCFMGTLTA